MKWPNGNGVISMPGVNTDGSGSNWVAGSTVDTAPLPTVPPVPTAPTAPTDPVAPGRVFSW